MMCQLVSPVIQLPECQAIILKTHCYSIRGLRNLIFEQLMDACLAWIFSRRLVPINQQVLPFCLIEQRQPINEGFGRGRCRLHEGKEMSAPALYNFAVQPSTIELELQPQPFSVTPRNQFHLETFTAGVLTNGGKTRRRADRITCLFCVFEGNSEHRTTLATGWQVDPGPRKVILPILEIG